MTKPAAPSCVLHSRGLSPGCLSCVALSSLQPHFQAFHLPQPLALQMLFLQIPWVVQSQDRTYLHAEVAELQPPPQPWSLGTASRERTDSPSMAMCSPGPRAMRTGRGLQRRTRTHLHLAALPQVEGQVLVDVSCKLAGVLRIELQHFTEPPQPNVLQVAVGQCLHVRVGLDHLVCAAQVGSNQIPFACRRGPGVG